MNQRKASAAEFLELLRPLERQLEVYCRRMLRDPSEVEDVLQSAVAEAFAKFDHYGAGTNFRAWIFRFVTLEAFNRNRKREPVPLAEIPAELSADESWDMVLTSDTFDALLDDPSVIFEHFDDAVVHVLARLSPLERAVLLLRAIGEFSYKEIHELLSIPVGSVIGYLSRARKRLRAALADYVIEHNLVPTTRPGHGSRSESA